MVTAYKLRLKDENRKMGVRGGYRFIYLLILGDIKIGDNATIGAGTLVMKDIEAGATYTGNTKMIRRR